MVSCVYRKCQTRAGVSEDVNMTFECITITYSKFSNTVLVWMTPESTSINRVTISGAQLDFCLHRFKCELPNQHIANCILPHELFPNIFLISTVGSHDMSYVTKHVYEAKSLISYPDSCWVPTLWLLRSDQHTYCSRCVVLLVYNVMRSSICATYFQECLKSSYRGNKEHHIIRITQPIYPGTSYIAPYTCCLEVMV